MASLDNFHRSNEGVQRGVRLPLAPVYGSHTVNAIQKLDLAGPPQRWDRYNLPVATSVRPPDPFSRVHLGRDVPGQEIRSMTSPYYVDLDTQPTILPGGNAESWVMYQDTRRGRSWLPLKY